MNGSRKEVLVNMLLCIGLIAGVIAMGHGATQIREQRERKIAAGTAAAREFDKKFGHGVRDAGYEAARYHYVKCVVDATK